jgi:hypothetical protein
MHWGAVSAFFGVEVVLLCSRDVAEQVRLWYKALFVDLK